jgi:type I restriction enzyme S subunit
MSATTENQPTTARLTLRPLGDLVEYIGAGISRAFFDSPDGVPALRSNNVRGGQVVADNLKYWHHVDPAGADLERVKPRVGDLLVNFVNGSQRELGKAAVFRGTPANCIVSTNFFIVRPRQGVLLPEYLNYFFQSPAYSRWLYRTCGFSGQGSFNQEQLRSLRVPWCTVEEQKPRVTGLSAFDAVAKAYSSAIAAKMLFKRGLMHQIFHGRLRFTKFRGRPWHSSPLENHVTRVTRRNVTGLQLVLTASGEHGLVDQRLYFNRRVAGADLTKYYLLKKGEFAYNRSAMIGYPFGATKRLDQHEAGALSTLYLCFTVSDPEVDSDYLTHVFESGVLNRQLRPIARVGARAHGLLNVTDDDFLSISIPLPKLDEQRCIAEVLNTLDRELSLLRAQRDLVEREKRALQSTLLSGEIAALS